MRPQLWDHLERPDGLGAHVHRLFLGVWDRHRMAFDPVEFLGEFLAAPGSPVGTSEWIGEHPDAYLHVVLPGGRALEVQSMVLTIGPGPWPPPGASSPRARKAKAAPPEMQSTLF